MKMTPIYLWFFPLADAKTQKSITVFSISVFRIWVFSWLVLGLFMPWLWWKNNKIWINLPYSLAWAKSFLLALGSLLLSLSYLLSSFSILSGETSNLMTNQWPYSSGSTNVWVCSWQPPLWLLWLLGYAVVLGWSLIYTGIPNLRCSTFSNKNAKQWEKVDKAERVGQVDPAAGSILTTMTQLKYPTQSSVD